MVLGFFHLSSLDHFRAFSKHLGRHLRLKHLCLKHALLLQNTTLQCPVLLKLKAFQRIQDLAVLPLTGFSIQVLFFKN